MWQIAWMLSFLPDWFWTLVLIAGVLGTIAAWVLKFIPFVRQYRLPIQVVSVLCLLVGVYFQGIMANEEKYKAEHERLQKEIAEKNENARKLNDDLVKAQAEKDAAIASRGQSIVKTIDRYVKGDPVEIVREVVKEKNLTEAERKKFEEQIVELQRAERECRVPSLLIEQVNQSAMRPPQEVKK